MMVLKLVAVIPIIICVATGFTHTTYVSVIPKSESSVTSGKIYKNKYSLWSQFAFESTPEATYR